MDGRLVGTCRAKNETNGSVLPLQSRSQSEKQFYFDEHHIKQERGFVLHHIVPLFFSDNQNEFYLHDKWENMIYINGTGHQIIHHEHAKHIIVDYYDNKLILKSFTNEILSLENNNEVIFSEQKIPTMMQYNAQLLGKR